MLSRVLVTELSQRLPHSAVISENGAVSAPADATIELNVQRLDEDASGNLVLQAQAGVNFKGRSAPALQAFGSLSRPRHPTHQGRLRQSARLSVSLLTGS